MDDLLTGTTTTDQGDEEDATVTELRAIRSTRTMRAPVKRARKASRPARKTAPTTRTPAARAKDTPGTKIAGYAALSASVFSGSHPVQAAILMRQAGQLGGILDRLAAEYPPVGQFIERLAGWTGKGGAAGEAGMWVAQTGAALALSGGLRFDGPLGLGIAVLGGGLLDTAINEAAHMAADAELQKQGFTSDVNGYGELAATLTEQFRAAYVAQIHERAELRRATEHVDQGAAGAA